MSGWSEAAHPRDGEGRFAFLNTPRGRIDRVLERAREVNVTQSHVAPNAYRPPTEDERRRQLAAMPERELRDHLRQVKPNLEPEDYDELPRETVERLIVSREEREGKIHVRDDRYDDEDDDSIGRGTREGDASEADRERASAEALDRYLSGARPEQSGGSTELPDDVEMIDIDELRDRVQYSGDGFAFHNDSEWNRLLDRQLADRRTPEMIEAIQRDGMQPLHIVDGDDVRNGHHRLAVAMLMGVRRVPVSRRDYEQWSRGRTSTNFAVPLR